MKPVRTKVSVSLPSSLLADVDRGVVEGRFPSRSAVVEQALRSWARQERDREIEEYYRSLPAQERAEDAAWAELGWEAFVAAAAAEEGIATRTRRRRGGVHRSSRPEEGRAALAARRR